MPKSVFTDAHMQVVAVLKTARLEADMLQADLAKKVGRGQSFVSNYERGERRIDLVEFYALAKALKADPIDLFVKVVQKLPAKLVI